MERRHLPLSDFFLPVQPPSPGVCQTPLCRASQQLKGHPLAAAFLCSPGPCFVPGALSSSPALSPEELCSQLARQRAPGKVASSSGTVCALALEQRGRASQRQGLAVAEPVPLGSAQCWGAGLRSAGLEVLLQWPGDFKGIFDGAGRCCNTPASWILGGGVSALISATDLPG